MSKTNTNTGNTPTTLKPGLTVSTTEKPVQRPTSNTNANMEYRGGKPSFTRKGKV